MSVTNLHFKTTAIGYSSKEAAMDYWESLSLKQKARIYDIDFSKLDLDKGSIKEGKMVFSLYDSYGNSIQLNLFYDETIKSVKKRIKNILRIPIDQQMIYSKFDGVLDNDHNLNKLEIDEKNSKFYIFYRICEEDKMFSSIGFDFSEIDQESLINLLPPPEETPIWKLVKKGLNLEGRCNNEKCDVERIWIQKGFGKFDIAREIFEKNCPKCALRIYIVNLGFWDCEYRIDGMKVQNLQKVEKTDRAPILDLLTFTPNQVQWAYLSIETTKIHEARYRCTIM